MKSKFKKVFATICLGTVALTSMPAVSFAETAVEPVKYQENEVAPRMTYIQRAKCDFTISGTTATIDSSVTGRSTATKAKVVAELQMKSGSTWVTVSTWTDIQDDYEAYVDATKSVTKGNTYRVKATVTVWEGSQSETKTVYSSEKTV